MSHVGRAITLLALAGALASTGIALAFSPTLDSSQIQNAVKAGHTMVSPKNGYSWKDHLIKQFDNGIDLTPAQAKAEVDAVVVATPYERVRYNSYLDTYQGTPLSQKDAQKLASAHADTVQFIVFAHSATGTVKNQTFLSKFGTATFEVTGGGKLKPSKTGHSTTTRDFYDIGTGTTKSATYLWLGYVSYTFDLKPLKSQGIDISKLKGTLTFTNSQGKTFSVAVDLGKYE